MDVLALGSLLFFISVRYENKPAKEGNVNNYRKYEFCVIIDRPVLNNH